MKKSNLIGLDFPFSPPCPHDLLGLVDRCPLFLIFSSSCPYHPPSSFPPSTLPCCSYDSILFDVFNTLGLGCTCTNPSSCISPFLCRGFGLDDHFDLAATRPSWYQRRMSFPSSSSSSPFERLSKLPWVSTILGMLGKSEHPTDAVQFLAPVLPSQSSELSWAC